MGGYTDVANAAKIANAVKNEDVLSAVMPALGIAGLTDVGGVSTQDIGKGIGALRAIESGDPLALLKVASSYLPGPAMPGTTGNEITEGFFEPGGEGFMPTASETAVGGGAETSGFFDAEEAQAVQDDIASLLARYPEAKPSFFPEFDAPLLTQEPPAPAPDTGAYYAPTPEEEKYADEDRLLAKYPAPVAEKPSTNMDPRELNQFLEANIEDPDTIDKIMQDYFPELYSTTPDQTIQVTGTLPKNDVIIPDWDFMEEPDRTPGSPTDTTPQPPVLDDDRTVAPTPAPTPAPAPGPSPAPFPAPSPSTAQSGMDMSGLFALLGMMNQDEDKPDSYQVAQINARSPFGTIYDQQQDLLGLMGRG
jgi:hypothetical protein